MKVFYFSLFFLIGQVYQPGVSMETPLSRVDGFLQEAWSAFSHSPLSPNALLREQDLWHKIGEEFSKLPLEDAQKKATECFEKSVRFWGNSHSMKALSKMYAEGRGVEKNVQVAQEYQKMAFEKEMLDSFDFFTTFLSKINEEMTPSLGCSLFQETQKEFHAYPFSSGEGSKVTDSFYNQAIELMKAAQTLPPEAKERQDLYHRAELFFKQSIEKHHNRHSMGALSKMYASGVLGEQNNNLAQEYQVSACEKEKQDLFSFGMLCRAKANSAHSRYNHKMEFFKYAASLVCLVRNNYTKAQREFIITFAELGGWKEFLKGNPIGAKINLL